MYTGRIVEESPVEELFARPKHPYTEGLLRSVPKLTSTMVVKQERLETIEGTVPSPTDLPPGCHFAPRCPHRMPRCTEEEIRFMNLEGSVKVRCVLFELGGCGRRGPSFNRQDAKVAKSEPRSVATGLLVFEDTERHYTRDRSLPLAVLTSSLARLASWRLVMNTNHEHLLKCAGS